MRSPRSLTASAADSPSPRSSSSSHASPAAWPTGSATGDPSPDSYPPGLPPGGPVIASAPTADFGPATPGTGSSPGAASAARPSAARAAALVILTLTMAAGAALLIPALARLPRPDFPLVVPGWLLAALFLAGATLGFSIRVRRGAHFFSLSEVPLVLGLALAQPLVLLAARAVGQGGTLVVLRRQRGLKLAFNLCLLAFSTCVAAIVYAAVLAGAPPTSYRGWLAALLAVVSVNALGATLVTVAVALTADGAELRRLPATVLSGLVPTCVNACLGLVILLTVERDPWASLLLLAVVGVAALAYRAFEAESVSHARVEQLYTFTRTTGAAVEVPDVVRAVLRSVRDQLRAVEAELVLPEVHGGRLQRVRITGVDDLAVDVLDPAGPEPWWARARSGASVVRPDPTAPTGPVRAIAVPLTLEEDARGALVVSGRLPDAASFTMEDLRLLETMGNHAGTVLANSRIVARLRRQAAEQEHNALHDALTGLPNRRYFALELEHALTRYDGQLVAVALMDLDGFKEINDTLGHDLGDRLLVEVGRRLRAVCDGFVSRLGGDEFALLVPGADIASTRRQLDRILAAVESPFPLDGLTHRIRASVGVALAPAHGTEAGILLARADVAMYGAKASGRKVEAYRADYDRNSRRRLTLLTSLGAAIEAGEITLAYQPQLAAADLRVVGVEALARWHHPTLGPVGPEEFVPLAEHSGLIRPLTLLVLETALRQRAAWAAAGRPLTVAVNLSARNLVDPTLPQDVAALLRRTRVPPSALVLEVTESVFMSNPDVSAEVLERLATLGVTLSVDDFGTGYSSLAYLQRLPFAELKIDRSFVLGLSSPGGYRAIVRTIVALGAQLHLRVVAEGVEDAASLRFLQEERCDVVQGYYFATPLPPAAFDRWLTSWSPYAGSPRGGDRGAGRAAADRLAEASSGTP